MIRSLLCFRCIAELSLHDEDVSNGFKERRVHIAAAKRPPDLKVTITTGGTRKEIPVPVMKCDACNGSIEEGAACIAVTHWRGVEPAAWEHEYGGTP
jgi:hypothetical protein